MEAIYDKIETLLKQCRNTDSRIRQIYDGEKLKNDILCLLRTGGIGPGVAQEILDCASKTYQLEHVYNQILRQEEA